MVLIITCFLKNMGHMTYPGCYDKPTMHSGSLRYLDGIHKVLLLHGTGHQGHFL